MDHPLLRPKHKDLRRRVLELLKEAYSNRRGSNIIFICGGNDEDGMRAKFRDYCHDELTDYNAFFPEFAMSTLFSDAIASPFNIAEFEGLVSELSHAIVLFPEAPGSFAETGYFSVVDKMAKKCILALDSQRQHGDSFISLGPAKNLDEKSMFGPRIQIDYINPDFTLIAKRIGRVKLATNRKHLSIGAFRDLSAYDICCLLHAIVSVLTLATIQDVMFLVTAMFSNRFSQHRVKQLLSVLVGAGYLVEFGEYDHLTSKGEKENLFWTRDGYASTEMQLKLELTELYPDDQEFWSLLKELENAN